MRRVRIAALGASLVLTVASTAFAQSSVDLRPLWNGTSFISSFGTPNTATYGQTIGVVSTETLLNFEFEIACDAPTIARAHVYAWDAVNSHATGASFFDSAPITIPGNGVGSFSPISTNTGGVTLAPGTYVIFLSTSEDQTVNTGCRWGALTSDNFYGASLFQFKFINNGTTTTQWTAGAWSSINEDLAFSALFGGGVPTMPEWILMILIAATTLTAAWMLRKSRARFQVAH
jgi:hypothetical protein